MISPSAWGRYLSLPSRVGKGTPVRAEPNTNNQFLQIMKKTIIALLALAGVVGAEETFITLNSPTGGNVTSGNSALTWAETSAPLTLSSWKVTFDLELTNKPGQTGIGDQPIFSTTRSGGTSTGIVFSSNTDGTVEIYHSDNSISENSDDSVLSVDEGISITISFIADYAGEEYKGGTFLVTSGETELLNFTVDETTEDTALKSGSSSVWTQSGNSSSPHIVSFSNIKVSQLADNVIPEPATATLSLLALAGLAARRRRK